MTNEQMIVNGIDVSGCEYCLKMIKYRCTIQRDVYKCLCEENPNCYYKQLQRKEGIIKRLKEKHNRMCKSCPKTISCDECSNNTTLKILNGEIV